ncbi:hypothetical protein SAMN02787118_11857 [Streptomyces mirabilis]|uniref:Uncharacterized protein n=1 Tax=Streptomyces mirabilis TaxID=68239 RepID=A0A1I2QJ95_9ACTN|nr:hypothetical protein SAMN02787118_11857 [Streptomyces mirabilis]
MVQRLRRRIEGYFFAIPMPRPLTGVKRRFADLEGFVKAPNVIEDLREGTQCPAFAVQVTLHSECLQRRIKDRNPIIEVAAQMKKLVQRKGEINADVVARLDSCNEIRSLFLKPLKGFDLVLPMPIAFLQDEVGGGRRREIEEKDPLQREFTLVQFGKFPPLLVRVEAKQVMQSPASPCCAGLDQVRPSQILKGDFNIRIAREVRRGTGGNVGSWIERQQPKNTSLVFTQL